MGEMANSPSSSSSEVPASSCSDPIAERDEDVSSTCTGASKQAPDTSPGVFRQGSSVCICEIFPPRHMNVVQVNLEVLANLCPVGTAELPSIIGIKYGAIKRGNMMPKKMTSKQRRKGEEEATPALHGNKFGHQVQLKMRLPGAENISIKFFKTGRLQTAGCRTREMSIRAVQDVAKALEMVCGMEGGRTVLTQCTEEVCVELCRSAVASVRVAKECILGSFSTGFAGPSGTSINMQKLSNLLSSGEFKDVVDRVKFNCEPSAHEAKFKQLGIFLSPARLEHAEQAVFVNIFSSGKCTVTAATSMELAKEVMRTVTALLCTNYARIVEDGVHPPPSSVGTQKKRHGTARRGSGLYDANSVSSMSSNNSSASSANVRGVKKAKRPRGGSPVEEEKSTGSGGESSEGTCSGSTGSMEGSSTGSSVSTMPDDLSQRSALSKSSKSGMVPMMQVIWCPPNMVSSMKAAGWCQQNKEKKAKHTHKDGGRHLSSSESPEAPEEAAPQRASEPQMAPAARPRDLAMPPPQRVGMMGQQQQQQQQQLNLALLTQNLSASGGMLGSLSGLGMQYGNLGLQLGNQFGLGNLGFGGGVMGGMGGMGGMGQQGDLSLAMQRISDGVFFAPQDRPVQHERGFMPVQLKRGRDGDYNFDPRRQRLY